MEAHQKLKSFSHLFNVKNKNMPTYPVKIGTELTKVKQEERKNTLNGIYGSIISVVA